MNSKRMVFLLLAVIVAGATAFLARAWLQAERAAVMAQVGVKPQAAAPAKPADPAHAAARALAQKHNCLTCHAIERKVVGPALRDIGKKHGGRNDAVEYLARKLVEGGSGVWGAVPMPAQNVPAPDARALATWLAAGAP